MSGLIWILVALAVVGVPAAWWWQQRQQQQQREKQKRRGKPRVFFGHGIDDHQMPIDDTSRKFAAQLKSEGYDVTSREYQGGHGVSLPVVREAFEWFLTKR